MAPTQGSRQLSQRLKFREKKDRESETTIKIKFAFFRGGGQGGREGNCPNHYFCGKFLDNKSLKVKILLSRNFAVMAQAPKKAHKHKHFLW